RRNPEKNKPDYIVKWIYKVVRRVFRIWKTEGG
ncbi:MAG: hypothetical protein ACI8XC_003715, partial [Gammaproteobacteria bacterium]